MSNSTSNAYMKKHLAPVIGAKVTDIICDDTKETMLDFGEPIWGLKLVKNGKPVLLWFMADAEGNGPGFPDIEGHS
jgi:hypothetical protein